MHAPSPKKIDTGRDTVNCPASTDIGRLSVPYGPRLVRDGGRPRDCRRLHLCALASAGSLLAARRSSSAAPWVWFAARAAVGAPRLHFILCGSYGAVDAIVIARECVPCEPREGILM
jgi:hypothetical protein